VWLAQLQSHVAIQYLRVNLTILLFRIMSNYLLAPGGRIPKGRVAGEEGSTGTMPDRKPLVSVTVSRKISWERFSARVMEHCTGAQLERMIYLILEGGSDTYTLAVSATRPTWQPIRALRQRFIRLAKSVLRCIGQSEG
jgi:hypothetical protein